MFIVFQIQMGISINVPHTCFLPKFVRHHKTQWFFLSVFGKIVWFLREKVLFYKIAVFMLRVN